MAKIKLSESTFTIIPEGTTVFKVGEVDDSKYEDFGKLAVKLQTAKGETHIENFSFIKKNGEANEGALKAWSYFARTCLNNFQADEIDTQDIVGCYVKATVKHEIYTRTQGEHKGEEATAVRLNDYKTATVSNFGSQATSEEATDDNSEDIDDLFADFQVLDD